MSRAVAVLLGVLVGANALANTLSGTVWYRDKVFSTADGSLIDTPMVAARYVTLDFVRASDLVTVLGTTTTDGAGAFVSPNIGSYANTVVLVKATGTYASQTVVVRDQSVGGGAIQTFQSGTFDLSGGSLAGQVINILADSISGAFNIYDCLIKAHKYVRESLFATPPTLAAFTVTVRWEDGKDTEPGAGHTTTEFYIVGGQRFVNVLGNAAVDSDAFDDPVLLHEYGHVAANLYSKDNSPGGAHLLGQALDLRLAFSEGWADFFAGAANGTKWYVDTNANPLGAIIFEVDTPAVTGAPSLPVTGPENELAVAAVIWDIVNSSISISNGVIDTPREAVWDIFDSYLPQSSVQDVSLEDFWDGFFVKRVTPPYGTAVPSNKTTLVAIAGAHDVQYYTDAYESNNSMSDARSITTDGTALHGTHYYDANADGIGEGDQDWYWFTAGTGKTYTIETLNLGNSSDTVLQVYASDGTTLLGTSDDIAADNLASRIVHTFAAGGKCYAVVTRSTKPLPSGCRANYGYYDLRITEGGTPGGPVVALISPANGATGIAVDTTVVATFSEPVQISTVTTSSFTLTAVSTAVPGTVSLDASRTVATFTPATALLRSTTYTVNLTTAVQDDDGNALTAFTSTFQTQSSGTPSVPVPRVPRAQIASGDGYVEIEWVYPAGVHDGVIVAVGSTRFPTISAVNQNGTVSLVVSNGTEVYRGNTDTTKRVTMANGQRAFVAIWTFVGTTVSEPYYLASRAARGGQGITERLAGGGSGEPPGVPTLPAPLRVQAVAGDGFVDVEWVPASGTYDGVIVGVGGRMFPKLVLTTVNGTQSLEVQGGTEVYRGGTKVRFRLATTNGSSRLCCVWMYKGLEFSRPLYAATRAARGAQGLTVRDSFYGSSFEPPGPP